MSVIDEGALKENCGGDDALLQEILGIYLEQAPALIAAIRESVERQDALAIKLTAHRLKGALLSIAAVSAIPAANELENLGAAGRLEPSKASFARLAAELDRVTAAVAALAGRS